MASTQKRKERFDEACVLALTRDFKRFATAGANTAAGSKFSPN